MQRQPDEAFEIHGANAAAVELFCFCSSQWRAAPMGGRMGLDYPAVISVMREWAWRRTDREDALWRVREIEQGALAEWSAQAEEERARKPAKRR